MEWTTVISLVLFGLLLIVVEVVFVPGTTLVGVAGFVFLLIGVAFSFHYFGRETGWATLGTSSVVAGLFLYFAFKSNVWGRFALKASIDSKVNEVEVSKFSVGLEGVAHSALRPGGKAEFANNMVEVRTLGEYVESGSRVRITRVLSNQIIVELIN